MLLDVLQCSGQLSTTKSDLAQNENSLCPKAVAGCRTVEQASLRHHPSS